MAKVVNYYFPYSLIINQLEPQSSYGVPIHQISFWYLIPKYSFNLESVLSIVVICDLDLYQSDLKYNPNLHIHSSTYTPCFLLITHSWQKLLLRNCFYCGHLSGVTLNKIPTSIFIWSTYKPSYILISHS